MTVGKNFPKNLTWTIALKLEFSTDCADMGVGQFIPSALALARPAEPRARRAEPQALRIPRIHGERDKLQVGPPVARCNVTNETRHRRHAPAQGQGGDYQAKPGLHVISGAFLRAPSNPEAIPAFSTQTVFGMSHSPLLMNAQAAPADWQQFTRVRLNC